MASYVVDNVSIEWAVRNTHLRLSDGFVFMVEWECYANNGGLLKEQTGVALLPDGKPTDDYSSLTEEEVLSWVWASDVSKDKVETSLVALITANTDPQYVEGLPWRKKEKIEESNNPSPT